MPRVWPARLAAVRSLIGIGSSCRGGGTRACRPTRPPRLPSSPSSVLPPGERAVRLERPTAHPAFLPLSAFRLPVHVGFLEQLRRTLGSLHGGVSDRLLAAPGSIELLLEDFLEIGKVADPR